jgi:hypothetical protein
VGTLHDVEVLFLLVARPGQVIAHPLAGGHATSGDLQRLPKERLGFRVGVIGDDLDR